MDTTSESWPWGPLGPALVGKAGVEAAGGKEQSPLPECPLRASPVPSALVRHFQSSQGSCALDTIFILIQGLRTLRRLLPGHRVCGDKRRSQDLSPGHAALDLVQARPPRHAALDLVQARGDELGHTQGGHGRLRRTGQRPRQDADSQASCQQPPSLGVLSGPHARLRPGPTTLPWAGRALPCLAWLTGKQICCCSWWG